MTAELKKWRRIFTSELIYSQIPPRKRPVSYSVYCVYSNFKHLPAEISEYFTLRRG